MVAHTPDCAVCRHRRGLSGGGGDTSSVRARAATLSGALRRAATRARGSSTASTGDGASVGSGAVGGGVGGVVAVAGGGGGSSAGPFLGDIGDLSRATSRTISSLFRKARIGWMCCVMRLGRRL